MMQASDRSSDLPPPTAPSYTNSRESLASGIKSLAYTALTVGAAYATYKVGMEALLFVSISVASALTIIGIPVAVGTLIYASPFILATYLLGKLTLMCGEEVMKNFNKI
jgi:hypothetical protein